MRIPKDVILVWPSTNASIPSGWSRETALDGKFPKAWGTQNPNETGGNETHTHTSPAHTHTMANHNHYIVTTTNAHEEGSTGESQVIRNTRNGSHYHTGYIPINSSSISSTSVTYGDCSNRPPYYDLIFIKAGLSSILKQNIIALWGGWNGNNNPPSNWQECNGANGSHDLRGKYLRGADNGADAGTTGGSYTNVHNISHGHTDSHSHFGYSGDNNTGSSNKNTDGNGGTESWKKCIGNHGHNIELYTYNGSVNSTISITCDETVEPEYKKLLAIQFKTGAIKEKGIIGLWLGSTSNIPKGWVLCDGNNGTLDLRNKFIKIANNSSEIGQTGGSNTHSHGAKPHSHQHTSTHAHSGVVYGGGWGEGPRESGHNFWSKNVTNPHTLQSVSNETVSYNSANTTADSASNEPEYRTAVFIQYQFATDGGFFLENFI